MKPARITHNIELDRGVVVERGETLDVYLRPKQKGPGLQLEIKVTEDGEPIVILHPGGYPPNTASAKRLL